MGRPRKHAKHLPANMLHRHGAYYFVRKGKWLRLAKDYGPSLVKYAELVGASPTVETVKDAVWHYIEHSDDLAESTLDNYRHSAAKLCAVFGHVALRDVTAAMVYRYLSEGGNVQANRDKSLLSAAFTHARNLGAFSGVDPTKGIQHRNKEKPRNRYVSDGEMALALSHASPKLGCIIRFCYLTGMRQGDALRVKLSDLSDDGITYWNTKGKKFQHVSWSPELQEVVDDARKLWRRFGREYLFESIPKGKHAKRGPGAYTPSGLRALWRVARTHANLTDIRLHDFRRKAGSDVEEGEATKLLGHTDPAVTKKHYRAKPERVKPVR